MFVFFFSTVFFPPSACSHWLVLETIFHCCLHSLFTWTAWVLHKGTDGWFPLFWVGRQLCCTEENKGNTLVNGRNHSSIAVISRVTAWTFHWERCWKQIDADACANKLTHTHIYSHFVNACFHIHTHKGCPDKPISAPLFLTKEVICEHVHTALHFVLFVIWGLCSLKRRHVQML